MNRERVEQLLRILDNIPPDGFDMRSFKTKRDCKTFMCLAGYAACDPWFVEQGLRWQNGVIAYGDHDYFAALRRFFEIGNDDLDEMFTGGSSDTVDDMKQRVRGVLNRES